MNHIIKKISLGCAIIFGACSHFYPVTMYASSLQVELFGNDQDDLLLKQVAPNPFLVTAIKLYTNNLIDERELLDLLGTKKGSLVTAHMLKQGFDFVFKKNRFLSIGVMVHDNQIGKELTIECKGIWILRSLEISGVMFGKDAYKRYYTLEVGDPFDINKHDHALDRIKDALRKNGYFQSTINATTTYDDQTKSVDVHIGITQEAQSRIGDITVHCHAPLIPHITPFVQKIQVRLSSSLSKTRYSWTKINESLQRIKKYLGKHGFNSVRVELEEKIHKEKKLVDLVFSFDISSKRESIFFGNTFFSREQLQKIIDVFGISIDVIPASMMVQEIKQHYYDRGFWQTQIETREEEGCTFFLINEGPRCSIDDIVLKNIARAHVGHIQRLFNEVKKYHYFDRELLQKAIRSMTTWYEDAGFLQMRVISQEFKYKQENSYTLELVIDEGSGSALVSCIIEGYPWLQEYGPCAALNRQLQRYGKVNLNKMMLAEQKQWLLTHFRQLGYAQVSVSYTLQGPPQSLSLTWIIDQGPKIYFGKTVVQGCSSIPYEHIMRELHYRAGDLWQEEKLQKSLHDLYALGLFENIQVYPDRPIIVCDNMYERPVIMKFLRQDPFEVRMRVGFGLQQVGKNFLLGHGLTYKLGGTFLCKNPREQSDQFIADVDFARSNQSIQCIYQYPWVFNLPIRADVKGYSTKYDQPGFMGSKETLYKITRQGLLLGLIHDSPSIEMSCNIGVELLQTTVPSDKYELAIIVGRALSFDPFLFARKIPYFLIEPTIVFDYVDNRLSPRKGWFTLVSAKSMFPVTMKFSDIYFVRIQTEQSFFKPVTPRFIFGTRVRFGHIFYKKFNVIMPAERFYLGGANSVRSYNTDLCPPLALFNDQYGEHQVAPRGGSTMFNANIEARFICYRALEVALFHDTGFLAGAPRQFFDKEFWIAGTGFGFRYNTPIGPLRFDIAWKWHTNRAFDESAYAWFLRLGSAF